MRRWLSLGGSITVLLTLVGVGQGDAVPALRSAATAPPATPVPTPGYWLVGADGGVFSFNAPFYGSGLSSNGSATDCPYLPGTLGQSVTVGSISSEGCTAMAATPGGSGYWIADSDQLPAAFGSSPSPQGAGCTSLNGATGSWSGAASTLTGKGFFLTSTNGAVMGCGDAIPLGGVSALHLPDAIVGMAATPDGKGYWLVANDGGVFAFGDAQFYGSMGGKPLNSAVEGIASTPDGKGYWLVAGDGGVFAFGDAPFSGSMGGQPLVGPVTGIAADPDGSGYWMVGDDGGVFSFGGAPFEGSMGGKPLDAPILGIAATPG
jgi:hypothetical protein